MRASRRESVLELCPRAAAACACEGLRRASRAISKLYESALAPLGLTATQFAILVAVHLRGPVPLSRLAEGLVLDRTSLYRAVKPLARRRCLEILPGRTGRERTAVLTPSGRRLLAEALPIWERVQERVIDGLGARTWTALACVLTRVTPTLHALQSGGAPRGASARQRRRPTR